jgi:hypothetical protein
MNVFVAVFLDGTLNLRALSKTEKSIEVCAVYNAISLNENVVQG